ncbi:MAG: tetratricopeptide repeat protein [Treponema sp.]|nr:tetratricopeptide repeat protein [Treponema sp.]
MNEQTEIVSAFMKGTHPDKEAIRRIFDSTEDPRFLSTRDIGRDLEKLLSRIVPHPTVKVRTKTFDSYYKKCLRQMKAGTNPPFITDLMGIRIVCPFMDDIATVEELIKDNYDVLEVDRKGQNTFREFGYESTHLLIKIPPDITRVRGETGCEVAEIQIRTTLQDAWAEVEHEIFYKAEFSPLDLPMKRKLAAVNASLSLADITFQEIRSYQKNFNGQLQERRNSFYQKFEETADAFIVSRMPEVQTEEERPVRHRIEPGNTSIDDLLLAALTIHNNGEFEEAIRIYSRILELKPSKDICSLIYKHRGMANFAQSKYELAISDFEMALQYDGKSHVCAYYRGIAHSVLNRYSEAIADFSTSLEITPYQPYCLFRRGQAYYHVGDYPRALADCDASLAMEPGNDKVRKFHELIQGKLKI